MLSFPPNTLRAEATLLPVIFRGRGVVALAKPAGVPADEHPWNAAGTPTLCGELRKRLAQKIASAEALGLTRPAAVAAPDADCSGATLLADRDGGALEFWRNALGSERLAFRFLLLSRAAPGTPDAFTCALPVAAHFSEARALVSHTTGKKSATRFERLEKLGAWELWRAETTLPRPHQIRLHAAESGIPAVGDALYGGAPTVLVSELRPKKRLNKGDDKAFYAAPCVHLAEIAPCGELGVPAFDGVVAPPPNGFETLLKKLRARFQCAS